MNNGLHKINIRNTMKSFTPLSPCGKCHCHFNGDNSALIRSNVIGDSFYFSSLAIGQTRYDYEPAINNCVQTILTILLPPKCFHTASTFHIPHPLSLSPSIHQQHDISNS